MTLVCARMAFSSGESGAGTPNVAEVDEVVEMVEVVEVVLLVSSRRRLRKSMGTLRSRAARSVACATTEALRATTDVMLGDSNASRSAWLASATWCTTS